MSGGSYEYVEYKLENNPLDNAGIRQLRQMYLDLLDPNGEREPHEREIGEILSKVYVDLHAITKQAVAVVTPILPLLHAIEWETSGDWSKEQVQEAWVEYQKSKSLNGASRS